MIKKTVADMAFFDGKKIFSRPVSTSNLVKPNVEFFLTDLKRAQTPAGEAGLIEQLENELAVFHEAAYCVSVCSGFWALVLCISELALPGKSEVVMPSLTYRRLADVVAWTGLVPKFCDVDPESLSISAETARPHINSNTALIIGVHPIVNCCDVINLEALSRENNLPVLFDSVESVYETYGGKKIGSFGAAECFSLHASKLINGFEGGYITTNNSELAARLKLLRNPSTSQNNFGMQANLPAVHAAMALQNFKGLENQIKHNYEVYCVYRNLLSFVSGVTLVLFDEEEQCSFKNILIRLDDEWPLDRDTTVGLMNSEGILSRAYYSPPLHMKTVNYPVITSSLPVSEVSSQRYMLMPCGYQVSLDDVKEIVEFMSFMFDNADDILMSNKEQA